MSYQESINQSGRNTHAKDLKRFIDNAIVDGGYWFGRFEASNNSGTKLKYDEVVWANIKKQMRQ